MEDKLSGEEGGSGVDDDSDAVGCEDRRLRRLFFRSITCLLRDATSVSMRAICRLASSSEQRDESKLFGACSEEKAEKASFPLSSCARVGSSAVAGHESRGDVSRDSDECASVDCSSSRWAAASSGAVIRSIRTPRAWSLITSDTRGYKN